MKAARLFLLVLAIFGIAGCAERTQSSQSPSSDIIWMVDVPEGFVRTLFTDEALTDESCWDCVIGDLERGIELAPRWKGCEQAEWDSSFTYCHVKVLTGPLAGKVGWVNIDCIAESSQ